MRLTSYSYHPLPSTPAVVRCKAYHGRSSRHICSCRRWKDSYSRAPHRTSRKVRSGWWPTGITETMPNEGVCPSTAQHALDMAPAIAHPSQSCRTKTVPNQDRSLSLWQRVAKAQILYFTETVCAAKCCASPSHGSRQLRFVSVFSRCRRLVQWR